LWPQHPRRRNPLLALYTFVLFSLGTVFVAMNTNLEVLSFIDNREFPGGPETYSLSKYSSALAVTPNAAFILANWMADGLLLFRCKVIWDGHYWILVLPVLMYLGSISMGIMTIFQSSRPNANLWTSVTVDFGLPYFSISASVNVLLTLLISARLFMHQRRMQKNLGSTRGLLPYNSIITMMVESSAIYAVSSLLFIGTYGANSTSSLIFLPILSQTQIIAPLLIISRVIRQSAWKSTSGQTSGSSPPFTGFQQSTTTHIDSIPLEIHGSPKKAVFSNGKEGSFHSASAV